MVLVFTIVKAADAVPNSTVLTFLNPLDSTVHLDPEVLLKELKKSLKHGCRTSRLTRYASALVDLLVPADGRPPLQRATVCEEALRKACGSDDGLWGTAMACPAGARVRNPWSAVKGQKTAG